MAAPEPKAFPPSARPVTRNPNRNPEEVDSRGLQLSLGGRKNVTRSFAATQSFCWFRFTPRCFSAVICC